MEVGLSNDEAVGGLISALGWLPDKLVHPWVKKFFNSKDLDHKYLALASCSVRRENPAEHLNRMLEREDCRQHEKLYLRALRLIGELKRHDLMPVLREAANSDDENIQFWSNWSAILLGDHSTIEKLEPVIFENGPYQQNAIDIAFRVLPVEQARKWIIGLVENKEQIRAAIKATGVLGDPQAVDWLINNMRDVRIAKICAEAFVFITGIDLNHYQLALEIAPNADQHPNDDADDDDVSLDEDENLPWPDLDKISQLWRSQGLSFVSGRRYFMGRPVNAENLNDRLINASQRQRHAAALELALSDATLPLPNTWAKS